MPDAYSCSNSTATEEASAVPKRRKVRKGTQSCWECKRRKIRCTFATPTETICDGCRSRRTKCISQKFHDEAAQATRKVDRLSRMESLVEELVNRSSVHTPGLLHQVRPDQNENIQSGEAVGPCDTDYEPPPSTIPGRIPDINSLLTSNFDDISSALLCIPSCSASDLLGQSLDYRAMMSRVFDTATRLVTSDDDLVHSLEGIECIMIESMYFNNAGNLRRAWLANRRAMVIAQMMRLHTGTSSPVILENETRNRIDPDCMWFRLVLSDRYLSLMLGLPQGSFENVFASPEAIDCCMAVERLERMVAVAAGLIIQRNGTERTDLAATYKIDKMLQEAAASMPSQWWLMAPDLTACSGNHAKALEESIRLMNQFAYHHLLVQLHLPYMMLPSSLHPSYDYTKMTAANASRTIIAQFVSFRNFGLATAYCRGIDFVAFIASTTLCLAHIQARHQHESEENERFTGFQSIQHQRVSDRALLEQTLEIMEKMAQSRDVVAQKISNIIRPLLAIENNSFRGDCYHICASAGASRHDSQCLGNTSEAFRVLCIQIPYFGTIQVESRPKLPNTSNSDHILSDEQPLDSVSSVIDTNFIVLRDPLVSSLN
ncbi:hypothetical protein UA08_02282 [Talaromyces atroroseus]|uniref:Zn(2)-C6 fungal-type domain-containing protein n=1 Tax=Talaromyces atroroseus TaxID=1441469 RepID=A0A225AYB8_TALAT|nr:hypothetical protein UA08_02282 [Talaromyces atroroseus]OKL62328.1 hypothetical protein UA08_02282 [Talaromyces atroroseus]